VIEEMGTQVRPPVPIRVRTLFLPLIVATTGLVVGGALGTIAYGVLWGAIAAAAILLACRIGSISLDRVESVVLAVGVVASAVATTRVMPGAPETIDVLLTVGFGLAWLPAGVAAGFVAVRKGAPGSAAFNVAIAWVGAGAVALAAGVTFEVIAPIDSVVRGRDPVFGSGHYAVIGLALGMIGAATLLAVAARLPALASGSIVAFITVFAASQVGFSIPELVKDVGNITRVPNFLPPDFDWAIGGGDWWWVPSWEFGAPTRANPLVETIRIAILATTFGCAVSLPLSFLASTLTAPNRPSYLIDKGFINLIRTVPDLFWAMIFVSSLGSGALAGTLALFFFSLAIMSKLLSETVDSAYPGPLEAAKATGSKHWPSVRSAVLPQVLPNYVAYSLYVFEINIRASVVLGLVGAGGIGQVLETQRGFFRFDRVLAVVIVIFVVVFVIEQVSIALRRRLV